MLGVILGYSLTECSTLPFSLGGGIWPKLEGSAYVPRLGQ